uniref:Aryl hydrocarbon receptor n=1 Tax=Angiostrongylus cantonensis TaxID=6313 RepID=A0A158P7R6_ANGCA
FAYKHYVHTSAFRVREPPKPSTSTNPSKRHRERLNGELETVAALLPYDAATISRLDKLSVLRLAVSYLEVKAHFHACLTSSPFTCVLPLATHSYAYCPQSLPFSAVPTVYHSQASQALVDPSESDFETIALKSLGGFLLIVNDNGEIYYASENIENFLGFHQSDVLHQSLYDLIHSEDRDDVRQQLNLAYSLPPGSNNPHDLYERENAQHLERNVNARFRCLLDNTCGFLRIDMRGKLMSLHGLPSSYVLGRSNPGLVMGLITVCTPFVPPSSTDILAEDQILKTKHQLDGTLVSMDEKSVPRVIVCFQEYKEFCLSRVHAMLELSVSELPISFYSLVNVEDAICLAEAHKEVIKNGSSGLLIYRLVSTKTSRTYFVQSSCRMFYKNGKPESIGLTHRLLNEVEGTMLLEKRSSLKAKLLSFDDSFLQSPRNLQSTAALPLPTSREDTGEESSTFNDDTKEAKKKNYSKQKTRI